MGCRDFWLKYTTRWAVKLRSPFGSVWRPSLPRRVCGASRCCAPLFSASMDARCVCRALCLRLRAGVAAQPCAFRWPALGSRTVLRLERKSILPLPSLHTEGESAGLPGTPAGSVRWAAALSLEFHPKFFGGGATAFFRGILTLRRLIFCLHIPKKLWHHSLGG